MANVQLNLGTGGAFVATNSVSRDSVTEQMEIVNVGDPVTATSATVDANGLHVNVNGALPTGANVIGNVGINGSLPAGSATIGGVTLAAAIPAGSNNIGSVNIGAAIPAGTNTIGSVKLTDGTNTAAVTAGSALKVDGSATTQPVSGTVSVNALPAGANTIGNVNITGSLPAGTNALGSVTVSNFPAGAGAGQNKNGSALYTPQSDTTVVVNVAANTTGTIISGVTGKLIYITAIVLMASAPATGSGTVTFHNSVGAADLSGAMAVTPETGIALGAGFGAVIVVPSGGNFQIITAGGAAVQGFVTYTQF